MSTPTPAELKRLAAVDARGCVSMYVPTHLPYAGDATGPLGLKNLCQEAERRLIAHGWRSVEVREFLKPVEALIANEQFWREPIEGLAMFVAPDVCEVCKLDAPVKSLVWVGRHFYLKPLLATLAPDIDHFVLAVNQKGAHLYRGDREGLELLTAVQFPEGLTDVDVIGLEHAEKVRQSHAGQTAFPGKQGRVFHGQGGKSDWRKRELVEYLRQVDRTASAAIGNSAAPVVFAGVEYLFPIYREVSTLEKLWPAAVHGNVEHWSDAELHRRTIEALAPLRDESTRHDAERFANGRGGDRVSASLEEIVHAAATGQVDTVFVAGDVSLWGTYDAATGHTEVVGEPHGNAEDLLDRIATNAFVNGGRVHVVDAADVPGGLVAAAVYRFPRVAVASLAESA